MLPVLLLQHKKCDTVPACFCCWPLSKSTICPWSHLNHGAICSVLFLSSRFNQQRFFRARLYVIARKLSFRLLVLFAFSCDICRVSAAASFLKRLMYIWYIRHVFVYTCTYVCLSLMFFHLSCRIYGLAPYLIAILLSVVVFKMWRANPVFCLSPRLFFVAPCLHKLYPRRNLMYIV